MDFGDGNPLLNNVCLLIIMTFRNIWVFFPADIDAQPCKRDMAIVLFKPRLLSRAAVIVGSIFVRVLFAVQQPKQGVGGAGRDGGWLNIWWAATQAAACDSRGDALSPNGFFLDRAAPSEQQIHLFSAPGEVCRRLGPGVATE